MTADTLLFVVKMGAVALIPVAFGFGWTAIQVARGDRAAFRQARLAHPKMRDALRGRAMTTPALRPDSALNEGLVFKRSKKGSYWLLNRRMSDEQYDLLTK